MIGIKAYNGLTMEIPAYGMGLDVAPELGDTLRIHLGINIVEIFRKDKEWIIRHNPNIVTEIVPIKYNEPT